MYNNIITAISSVDFSIKLPSVESLIRAHAHVEYRAQGRSNRSVKKTGQENEDAATGHVHNIYIRFHKRTTISPRIE